MDEIRIFENEEFGSVRTVDIDGKTYFMANDIAKALGYSDCPKAIRTHCKGVAEIATPTAGGVQKVKFIPEGDIYRLVIKSQLPSADRFETWIFDEVLPSIRKHGMYAKEELLDNPDMFISVLQKLKAERERNKICQQTISIQNQQIAEMQPKVSYYDVVLNCKDLVAISTISKDYGWSATKMNEYLHEIGVQYRQGKIWLLYENYAKQGYTSTKTHTYNGNDGNVHVKPHTYWTPKGRLFLYNKLKENGIYPLIEQEK